MNDKKAKADMSAVEFTKPSENKVSLEQLVKAGQEFHRRRPYASEKPVVPVEDAGDATDVSDTSNAQEHKKRPSKNRGKAHKKTASVRTAEQERLAIKVDEARRARNARRRYVVNLPLTMLENLDVIMLVEGLLSRNEVVERLLGKAMSEYDLEALRKKALGD